MKKGSTIMKIKTTFSVAIYHLFIYCCFDVRVGAFYPPFPKKTCILMLSHWQKKKTKLSQISAVPVFQGLVFQETGNKQKIFSATQCSLLSNTNQIFLYLNCSISPVFWVKAILAKPFTAVHCAPSGSRGHSSLRKLPSSWRATVPLAA